MTSTDVAVVEPTLVPAQTGLVRPVAGLDEIRTTFERYQELCQSLLVADDFQRIRGKEFKKKSAYRKLAVAFGVSCEIIDRRFERDSEGQVTRAEFVVRATAPNGRYMEGWGACDITEQRFEKEEGRQKVGHDIPATAETRAKNRACSDLFGMGEVSAEEAALGGAPREATVDDFLTLIGWDDRGQHDFVRDEIVSRLRDATPKQQASFKEWREEAGINLALISRPQSIAIARKLIALGIIVEEDERAKDNAPPDAGSSDEPDPERPYE